MLVGVFAVSCCLSKMPFIEGEVFGLLSRVGGHLRDVRLLYLLELKRRQLSIRLRFTGYLFPIKFFQAHGNVGPSTPSLSEGLGGSIFWAPATAPVVVSAEVKEVD